jgi:hypothetical protein
MAVTGIPQYTGALPIEYILRCTCGLRYLVFTGKGMMTGDAKGRAKDRAANLSATFIDARLTPFMQCICGQLLSFTSANESMVM